MAPADHDAPARCSFRPLKRGAAIGLLAILALAASCSRLGSVSGDIYVRSGGGEIVRGADVNVVLVPTTSDFDARWQKLEADLRSGVDEAMAQCRTQRVGSICFEAGEVHRSYSQQAVGLVNTTKVMATRADINGRYELRDIIPGRYYLLASLDFMDSAARRRQRLAWRIPLQVGTGGVKLDLAASNSDSAAFDLGGLNAKEGGK